MAVGLYHFPKLGYSTGMKNKKRYYHESPWSTSELPVITPALDS